MVNNYKNDEISTHYTFRELYYILKVTKETVL